MSREIMEQALDVIKNATHQIEAEWIYDYEDGREAIAALEAELAKPEQDHGFDRTASHMTGEYVDTAQSEQEHEIRITALEIRVAKLENPMTIHEKQLLAGQRGLLRTAPNVSTNQQNVNTSEERVHEMQRLGQELEQEPWLWIRKKYSFEGAWISNRLPDDPENWDAVYKAPPKREWVGLTDDEVLSLVAFETHPLMNRTSIVKVVEAKLREKNG